LQVGQHPCAALTLGREVELNNNPLIRVLVVLVMIAAGIRLIFWLLMPIWPYLAAALVIFIVIRVARWHQGRW
jgi:hypothetical protein